MDEERIEKGEPTTDLVRAEEKVCEVDNGIARKRKPGRPKKKSRDAIPQSIRSQVLTLAAKHVPNAIIAKATGIDPSNISRMLKQYSGLLQELEFVGDYRRGKADLLDAAQMRVLKYIASEEKMAAANIYQLSCTYDVLYKAGRLERNQSTSNLAIARFTAPQCVTDN